MDLSVQRWEGATAAEREALGRRLATQLPAGFSFHGVRPCRLVDRQHNVGRRVLELR